MNQSKRQNWFAIFGFLLLTVPQLSNMFWLICFGKGFPFHSDISSGASILGTLTFMAPLFMELRDLFPSRNRPQRLKRDKGRGVNFRRAFQKALSDCLATTNMEWELVRSDLKRDFRELKATDCGTFRLHCVMVYRFLFVGLIPFAFGLLRQACHKLLTFGLRIK